MSSKVGGPCRACQGAKRKCPVADAKRTATKATKKSGGGAAAKKKAKATPTDSIAVGDSAGVEEVVVKQEGVRKAKRKAVEFAEELPKKKRAKVEDDRGEGSSGGIGVSVEEAKAIGKKFFPDLYFGKLKEVWLSRTQLLATEMRLLWLKAECATLEREIETLERLRLFTSTALENPDMMEDEEDVGSEEE